ncbi:hypothetical protein BHE74_00013749, partial [Ensete ventricosum]
QSYPYVGVVLGYVVWFRKKPTIISIISLPLPPEEALRRQGEGSFISVIYISTRGCATLVGSALARLSGNYQTSHGKLSGKWEVLRKKSRDCEPLGEAEGLLGDARD